MIKKRAGGVLLSITSLPYPYGIGCLSKEAYEFVDYLAEAGQSYWQILPVGPTSYGDSPYAPFSTFAGNPYFIDLETLIEEGLLTKEECDAADFGSNPKEVDYGKIYNSRYVLLQKAYDRSQVEENPKFHAFLRENEWWLEDYALFMSIKKIFSDGSWMTWAEDIRQRWDYSMDYYRQTCRDQIMFQKFMQFKFREQWDKLKKYANGKGIKIIGDLPIYVAYDSADCWSHPELFQLDDSKKPYAVAGCPPDAFSEEGQLWGNPLYRWDYHRGTGFEWWKKRFEYTFTLYDVVRIDHFRGFDEYFSIPAGDKNARGGHWEKGPGIDLFHAVKTVRPDVEIIAEDLGFMTDSVRKMVAESGFPNMKVLEFAWDVNDETDHMPHRYEPNCVVYTGTHDNSTLVSWYQSISKDELKLIARYTNSPVEEQTPEEKNWTMIRLAMYSVANTCIIPMQDYLILDDTARMNEPSTLGKNWKWRMDADALTKKLSERMYSMLEESYRLSDNAKRERWEKKVAAEKAAEAAAAKKATAEKVAEAKAD